MKPFKKQNPKLAPALPEKLADQDFLSLHVLDRDIQIARLRLEAAEAKFRATAQDVFTRHGVSPADQVDMATGVITRVGAVKPEKQAEKPAPEAAQPVAPVA